MMKKNKYLILVICALLAIALLFGLKNKMGQETEPTLQNEVSDSPDEAENNVQENISETEENKSGTDEAIILINEGNVQIIVPDDQEMGGE